MYDLNGNLLGKLAGDVADFVQEPGRGQIGPSRARPSPIAPESRSPRLRGRRSYAAPWPQITVRPFSRIRRRAEMSACPTCERSSPRQRSNPSLGNRCLPH
jgi:hypothetical protein